MLRGYKMGCKSNEWASLYLLRHIVLAFGYATLIYCIAFSTHLVPDPYLWTDLIAYDLGDS
jgi:hypothetical protein